MSCCSCKTNKWLKKICRELQRVRFLLSRPGRVYLISVEENDMAIKFVVVLPVPPAVASDWKEVASGELIVKVGDGEPIVIATDKLVQEGESRQVIDDRFVGPQDALVSLEFAYIDDSGNKGTAVVASQPLLDTVPPVTPESIGLVSTEEVPDVV
jgi:hypothetical protein